jgi:DNA polymerase-3 subunit gamma/tau
MAANAGHQALYRRYRPRRFADVRGQEHVVTALRNAVREGRVAHAYLFSGPRGTGKTSTARILAKVLNCEKPVDGEPCLHCESCLAVESGTSFDIHELDAASNNKVDDIRDLVERVAYGSPGRTKVYILDEVHMLTPAASAALLKTLEEPPEHVVFVLATTDPQKVLPTIRSRTQHFEFHLLAAAELDEHVRWVIGDAGLDVADDAVADVVRAGAGSARDALSALDQVAVGGTAHGSAHVDGLLDAVLARDTGAALAALASAVAAGRDPKVVATELVGRLRDVFLAAVGAGLDHLGDQQRAAAETAAERCERSFLTRALEGLGEALVDMREAADPRVTLDVALVRLTDVGVDTSLGALLERVERLEKALANGPAPTAAPTAASTAATSKPQAAASRPADTARAALGAHRRPEPAPNAASKPRAEPATVVPSAPPPPSTDLPSRDELTLAWGDQVLGALPKLSRALFAAGRFLDPVDGVTVFALPSAVHRDKCEGARSSVEQALAAHFGRTVPLRLVVDAPGASPAPAPTPAAASVDDEVADVRELADAPPDGRTGFDRLLDAFPGAEEVSER